jgi:thiol-disulfide isomerase/thioredoxin
MRSGLAITVGLTGGLIGLAAALYGFLSIPESRPTLQVASETAGNTDALTFLGKPRSLPELRFLRGDGAVVRLSDFEGRVVLLNIWATWCVPCREEMPTLDRLEEQLGGPGFEVVALSIDNGGADKVAGFYQELGIRHLTIYVESAGLVGRELGMMGVPTTLLIDRQGRELARKMGSAAWDSPEIVTVIRQVINASRAGESMGIGQSRRSERVQVALTSM